ncbi:MAG: class I SAM-dependent methyltransferase [Polyangiaceae bacterium]|nr:class I SAM-dependent methyltransferase [Myxococcales bacterium]MCB9584432.1 class I SAM-dependent methyltransferase [Polyangiaceae bacterium]
MAQNSSYVGLRSDMLEILPTGRRFERVLDVGCATGATGSALKQRGAHVTGIEYSPESAAAAKEALDEVLEGDAGVLLGKLAGDGRRFDLVLCGDVIEHLVDPWTALATIRRLVPNGLVVVSLPNVAHLSTFSALLSGQWPYRERGIHDRTHLRFFGERNLKALFAEAGFEERERRVHHRVIERPHWLNEFSAPLTSRLPVLRRYTAYQFVSLLA